MSYQPQTEAATSRFLNVDEGAARCVSISMTAATGKRPWSCCTAPPGPPAGPTSAAILTRWSRRAIACCSSTVRVGQSDAIVNSGSRSDLNARILKSVVDQLGIDKVHLLGNSMGGHSAVAFTLSWPERVAAGADGRGTSGMSLFTPMPTEGIKLLNALYREPTIENLKKMMSIFVSTPATSPRRCSRRVSTICCRAATIWTTSSRARSQPEAVS